MLINGKMSYNEIEQSVFLMKDKIVGSYLKKVFHYKGMWLFKFNHFSFVFEPQAGIWPGTFTERETNLHSISVKIRKDVGDHKITGFDLVAEDRTIIIQFYNYKIILELYAKGNIILTDIENKIIVLTRIYTECSHGNIYNIPTLNTFEDFKVEKYGWVPKENSLHNEISNKFEDFDNILDALAELWTMKQNNKLVVKDVKQSKKRKNKNTVEDNIRNQITGFTSKIDKKLDEISKLEDIDYLAETVEEVDYTKIGKLHTERKVINKKLLKADVVLEAASKLSEQKTIKIAKQEKIKLVTHNWYQKYHWWYTKNGFLVVGGKSASDNEKLVKSHLNDNDLYFHSEDPGSGSFIMFTENRTPDFTDIDETAEGVLALSCQWSLSHASGDVFYVKGNQVSKTPPTGEYVGKGSFMIYGKKDFVKVSSYTLGYGLYDNKLMLAPFRIVCRTGTKHIKLKPRTDIKKMKGKILNSALKKVFNIELTEDMSIFNKPCTIVC